MRNLSVFARIRLAALVPMLVAASSCSQVPPPRPLAGAERPLEENALSIPVTAADPVQGSTDALVTVVVFGDYECPHCRRANTMLADLAVLYGPDKLRVVWKHFPIDPESTGRTAAELSIAVRELGGNDAFWAFHRSVFDPQTGSIERRLATAIADASASAHLGLQTLAETGKTRGRAKVEADIALGVALGVKALPSLFVNGVFLEGVGTRSELSVVIDAELRQSDKLVAVSGDRAQVYQRRVLDNLSAARSPFPDNRGIAKESSDEGLDTHDETTYRVPIAGSPTVGNPAALVTLVEFADFECRFCGNAAITVNQLRERYGDKLRVVFKNNPLAFHERALSAAHLALEIRAQKGDEAFFRASDTLFSAKGALNDALFDRVSREAGIQPAEATRAIQGQRYLQQIEDDQLLADDVKATGTPYFYVNGKRIKGARSLADFVSVIDTELAFAQALVKAGVAPADVYASIMSRAAPPADLLRVELPPADKTAPLRGPASAPVVVDVFADFQCGFCRVHAKRMSELEQAFPGKLRLVFHNFPLPGHERALPAAIAALEAQRQKGDKAFFRMHDLLFEGQEDLGPEALLARGAEIGLDTRQLQAALAGKRFDKALAADAALAERLGVDGTPTTFINGYRVGGAAPLVRFKKAVRQALADADSTARNGKLGRGASKASDSQ